MKRRWIIGSIRVIIFYGDRTESRAWVERCQSTIRDTHLAIKLEIYENRAKSRHLTVQG